MFAPASLKTFSLALVAFLAIASAAAVCPYRQRQIPNPCRCNKVEFNVCGTDGRNYRNLCWLFCASLSKPSLALKHFGKCPKWSWWSRLNLSSRRGAAAGAVTGDSSVSEMDSLMNLLNSVSSFVTTERKKPVAEVDLIVEGGNSTEEEAREKPQAIGLPCSRYLVDNGGCNAARCQDEELDPVCSTMGTTYRNYCDFCCAYLDKTDFKIWYKGECNSTRVVKDEDDGNVTAVEGQGLK